MRKKILLTMMLLTVCAIGTNSIFATENVEKNEIEVYEISLKKFDSIRFVSGYWKKNHRNVI